MQNDQSLCTIEEVCNTFKCSKSTVWRWVSSGTLPKPLKIGGTSRWATEALSLVIKKAQVQQMNPAPEPKRNALRSPKLSRRKKAETGGQPQSGKISRNFPKGNSRRKDPSDEPTPPHKSP